MKISHTFIPRGPINNKPELLHIMARQQIGGKPFTATMMVYFTDTYMHHATLMS